MFRRCLSLIVLVCACGVEVADSDEESVGVLEQALSEEEAFAQASGIVKLSNELGQPLGALEPQRGCPACFKRLTLKGNTLEMVLDVHNPRCKNVSEPRLWINETVRWVSSMDLHPHRTYIGTGAEIWREKITSARLLYIATSKSGVEVDAEQDINP